MPGAWIGSGNGSRDRQTLTTAYSGALFLVVWGVHRPLWGTRRPSPTGRTKQGSGLYPVAGFHCTKRDATRGGFQAALSGLCIAGRGKAFFLLNRRARFAVCVFLWQS